MIHDLNSSVATAFDTSGRELACRAENELLNLIAAGRLLAGAALIEADLTARLRLSRGVVREVLTRLETARIAVNSAERGWVVRRLSRAEAADFLTERGRAEVHAAQRLAQRQRERPVLSRASIVDERRRWKLLARRCSPDEFRAANRAFHQLIIDSAGINHEPGRQESAALMLFYGQFRAALANKYLAQSCAQHLQILEAIELGDEQAAYDSALAHLQCAAQLIASLPDDQFA